MTEADGQWRVGDLAREAGITVRTLHHDDRLGLLKPSSDQTVQPSIRQFLQLIEETATMTELLTPEQVTALIENRRTQMEQLGTEEFAALAARREHHVAALSSQEKEQLNNRQRAVARPTGDPQA
ncbi:MerR family DNA-binding transcriptional regulator [Catenulispora pinisilvae]|uniref:MerR family DNA-binding transcriptional regulator n=1 Tax=Catenulispora pinisilvae TaxID=2705253 RepID=UPI001892218F|nr:MerR family DNA-binding transcriptional regulator [Catenulispora pinisilvae]